MSDQYPQAIAELLAIQHPVSLRSRIAKSRGRRPITKLDGLRLLRPDGDSRSRHGDGLPGRLVADSISWMYRAQMSQGIDTPAGSFWHAIMHRREGAFGNSKCWWRRPGPHPALIGDPFEFVDAVEEFVKHGRGDADSLQTTQDREWQTLFRFLLPQCNEWLRAG